MQEDGIYRLLFEHAAQGMVLWQAAKIVLVNQCFASMVGYTIDELLSLSAEEALGLIHPQDRATIQARFCDLPDGKDLPRTNDHRFIRRDGQIGWWSATVSTLDYAGQPAILGIYADITERKKAEEAVDRSSQLLAAILDVLPVGVCLNDEAGYYRMMNDAYCATYEYDRDEMLGQHYSVIMPPDQIALANAHYTQMLSGDVGIPIERKRQRKDGSIVYIEAANALVKSADGQTMVITTVRDITERLQARAEIERLAYHLAEQVKKLDCLYGISQLIEEPGASLGRIVEETARLIPAAFQYPDITCARITLENHRSATSNFSETPWRLSTNIVAFGVVAGTLEVYLLEAQPEAEEPFLAEERTLIGAVAERLGGIAERVQTDAALKQLNAELQARNEDLNAFAHTVAHDLKNPITVIVGFAEVLRDDYATLPAGELEKALRQIAKHGRKMRSIVNELLLLSSVRNMDEVNTAPLDMGSIVAEVHENLREMLTEYRGEITVPDKWPAAIGYSPWVEEVWVNYISNALKYGGIPPRLELGADETVAGQVRFWVKDNGRGLSPAEQSRIFKPFERLEQQRMAGHGLGLSIVRRIVEKLGGQVGVESEVGQGSTFYFTLPAALFVEHP